MKKLLENIGLILETTTSDDVKAKARALLQDIANPAGRHIVLANYIRLVCAYLESMDAGASYDAFEFVADATADWLDFSNVEVVRADVLDFSKDYNNPSFPLFADASTDVGGDE